MKILLVVTLLLSTVCFAQKEMYTVKGTIQNSDSDYIL